MSCAIGAIPFLLIYGAVTAVTALTTAAGTSGVTALDVDNIDTSVSDKDFFRNEIKRTLTENNGEVTQEMLNNICKEYLTVFMDKDLLVKTLKEYGFSDFTFDGDKIKCSLEAFHLEFDKEDSSQPYKLNVTCQNDCDDTSLIGDLNDEYALNTQEESYIKIKERLEKKNLKIDEEEILEDDSIMLTINLD